MKRSDWRRTRAVAHGVTNGLWLVHDLTRLGAHLVRARVDRWWADLLEDVEQRGGEYPFERETRAQRKARHRRARDLDW